MRKLLLRDNGSVCLRSLSLRVEEAERLRDYGKAINLLEMLLAHEHEACAKIADQRASICYEAAGFEPTTPCAKESENACRHEAAMIAAEIRKLTPE